MKTTKLPKSAWSDSQAAGSQSHQQTGQLPKYYLHKDYLHKDSASQVGNVGHASNDASYNNQECNDECLNHLMKGTSIQTSSYGYKSITKSKESAVVKKSNFKVSDSKGSSTSNSVASNSTASSYMSNTYKKAHSLKERQSSGYADIDTYPESSTSLFVEDDIVEDHINNLTSLSKKNESRSNNNTSFENAKSGITEIPERIFMNGLIKHTGIALAIIIPLAAFSAYAASPPVTAPTAAATNDNTSLETLAIKPSSIIHKSANTPTTVDSVDLKKYAGTWYEIGRLPMYFQRNCASDVTATYVEKTDGSGIKVINQCKAEDGSGITAEGIAKPADATGSKLKVTFLPSWIRWLPVGRADYWILARDEDYKTALVGAPNKKYLWLLARSPNVSQETYAKYRQIAQQQGYDLKEFKLTPQTNQTVRLVP
ncbi:lipocalin family protein [Psychrobacter sp. DAB_AL62B]|uniref:lipocalin family protein n=1 Tax=Psychrobacter sp. DAB_AL62B TaxID=1028420 RepID=UPI0023813E05|nr:lipocalin family protein [Psychrobacter sp. DAB_AL62B]MDE4454740.1 lipocalin [Psychrobacter sp. DAB_AL62B]